MTTTTTASCIVEHFNVVTGLMERPPPSKALTSVLENLASDKKNIVYIISGKERKDLMRALGGVARLGLAAEHGLYYRPPEVHGAVEWNGLDWTGLDCSVLCCTVLYCTVLYCTVLHCTVLYCTAMQCNAMHWNVI